MIWAAGVRAAPLTAQIPAERDNFGRLLVGRDLRARTVPGVFATGDAARAASDDIGNYALMSCQHATRMGAFAGLEALQTAHWAVRLQPKFWLGRQVLAACLSACDQMAEAEKATAELKRDYPGLTSDEFAAWFPYANPDDGKLVTEALRRAGWQ